MSYLPTTNVVLLCYGNTVEYQRAIVTILSLLSWKNPGDFNVRLLCYTDNPEYLNVYLQGVEIEYFLLSEAALQEMAGENNYIHRRKICVLEETALLYPKDHIVFLDSDTFFFNSSTDCLNQLKLGTSLMHEKEYRIEQGPDVYDLYMNHRIADARQYPLAFLSFIQKGKFMVQGEHISFYKEQYIWNSGVVGINNRILFILRDILSFSDQTFSETKWFISEQLAFCLLLQAKTKLTATSPFINHYHRHKDIMDSLIKMMLNDSFSRMTITAKLKMVKKFTVKANRIVQLDLSLSMAVGEFKNKRYWRTAKYAYGALKGVTLGGMFLTFMKRKIHKAANLKI
jgi:hypothetical protein